MRDSGEKCRPGKGRLKRKCKKEKQKLNKEKIGLRRLKLRFGQEKGRSPN
jgi:hypothetical protein